MHTAEHVVTDYGGAVRHAWSLSDDLVNDGGGLIGALQRCGIGELDRAEYITLVLIGQKASGNRLAEPACEEGKTKEQQETEAPFVNEHATRTHVAVW